MRLIQTATMVIHIHIYIGKEIRVTLPATQLAFVFYNKPGAVFRCGCIYCMYTAWYMASSELAPAHISITHLASSNLVISITHQAGGFVVYDMYKVDTLRYLNRMRIRIFGILGR
jgi:hypothetical protein